MMAFCSTGSPSIDIFQIDAISPGMLGAHFVDLSLYIDNDLLSDHFPSVVANNTINDRLVAMPWFIDAWVLYYRRDLLDKYGEVVPNTGEPMN